jgi:glycerol uptake facilitator-like aquaporin
MPASKVLPYITVQIAGAFAGVAVAHGRPGFLDFSHSKYLAALLT